MKISIELSRLSFEHRVVDITIKPDTKVSKITSVMHNFIQKNLDKQGRFCGLRPPKLEDIYLISPANVLLGSETVLMDLINKNPDMVDKQFRRGDIDDIRNMEERKESIRKRRTLIDEESNELNAAFQCLPPAFTTVFFPEEKDVALIAAKNAAATPCDWGMLLTTAAHNAAKCLDSIQTLMAHPTSVELLARTVAVSKAPDGGWRQETDFKECVSKITTLKATLSEIQSVNGMQDVVLGRKFRATYN